ncbi:MAG: hypothetical protein ACXABF_17250 [Candidatus Thorarchaeota archaeon]|jgi:hypothetical protein
MTRQEEKTEVEMCARCGVNPVHILEIEKDWKFKCEICLDCLEEAIDFLMGDLDDNDISS